MSVKKKSFTNYKQYSLGSFRKDSTGLNLGSISLQKMGSFEPSKARVACQFTPLPKSEDMMGKPKPSIRSVCHWLKGWIGGFSSKTRKKSPDLTVPARTIFDFHIGLSIPLVPRFQSSSRHRSLSWARDVHTLLTGPVWPGPWRARCSSSMAEKRGTCNRLSLCRWIT